MNRFFNTIFGQRICYCLQKVLQLAKENNAVVVFSSQASYGLYRLCKQYDTLPDDLTNNNIVIPISDVKIWYEETWNSRPFFLLDIVSSDGITLFQGYKVIRKQYPDSKVTPILLFSAINKQELKEQLQNDNSILVDAFIHDLKTEYQIPHSSIGRLSYELSYMFQNQLNSYAFVFPVTLNCNYEYDHPETKTRQSYLIVPKEAFTEFRKSSGEWKYVDASYFVNDIEGEYAVTKKIPFGFFRYQYMDLYFNMGNLVETLIVNCRYEILDNENVAVVLSPFVVIKPISYENALEICRKLYVRTKLGDWLEDKKNKPSCELLLVFINRFISIYTWMMFRDKVKLYFNVPNIETKIELISDNDVWQDTIETVYEFGKIELQSRIRQVCEISGIYTDSIKIKMHDILNANSFEKAYKLLFDQFLEAKRENLNNGFISIEQMRELIDCNSKCLDNDQKQRLFISSLLQMLNQGILEQQVLYENGVISNGFRLCELVEIALPFYNPYIMYAVYVHYLHCVVSQNTENAKESYFAGIQHVFQILRTLLKENDSIHVLFDEDILNENERYFSDKRANLCTLLENKAFRVEKDKRIKIVDKMIKDAMSCS